MLIAVQNAQADLRAGFTAARDMSSHGNGYGDVDIRNAINQGRFDGPRYQVSTLGIVWGAAPPNPANPREPAGQHGRFARPKRGAPPCASRLQRGADWIKLFPTGGYSFNATGEAQYVADLSAARAAGADRRDASPRQEGRLPRAWRRRTEKRHRRRLRHHRARVRPGSGASQHDGRQGAVLRSDLRQRYIEPYMDDNDAKNTGGKYRMIPIFEKAVSMAAATKGMKIMMGSGADGSTYPHGTQALDFEMLVKRGGLTPARAIQGGTIINAEVDGMAGSDRVDRQGQVRRPDRRVRRSARRHHRASARQVRDEGRKGHQERHGVRRAAVANAGDLRQE